MPGAPRLVGRSGPLGRTGAPVASGREPREGSSGRLGLGVRGRGSSEGGRGRGLATGRRRAGPALRRRRPTSGILDQDRADGRHAVFGPRGDRRQRARDGGLVPERRHRSGDVARGLGQPVERPRDLGGAGPPDTSEGLQRDPGRGSQRERAHRLGGERRQPSQPLERLLRRPHVEHANRAGHDGHRLQRADPRIAMDAQGRGFCCGASISTGVGTASTAPPSRGRRSRRPSCSRTTRTTRPTSAAPR